MTIRQVYSCSTRLLAYGQETQDDDLRELRSLDQEGFVCTRLQPM
jgi:hypothetical protein